MVQRRRSMWVSDELWQKITIAARLDGRSASSWLRARAEMALAKEIRRVIVAPPTVDEIAEHKAREAARDEQQQQRS